MRLPRLKQTFAFLVLLGMWPSLVMAGEPSLSGPLQIRLWNISDRGEVVAGVPHGYDLYTRALNIYPDHQYAVFVYGGSDAELTAAGVHVPTSADPRAACINSGKAVRTFLSTSSYSITNPDKTKETSFFTLPKEGPSHLYAVIVRYPPYVSGGINLDRIIDEDRRAFCETSTSLAPGFQISANVISLDVGKNYNCPSNGICITDVNPQTLPANQNTSRYKIKVRGRDRTHGYAFLSGRYQGGINGALDKDECNTLRTSTAASPQLSGILPIIPERVEGNLSTYPEYITYEAGPYTVNFTNDPANRRIVAFLFKWTIDPTNPTAGAPRPEDYCDHIADARGWMYGSTGGGPTPGGNTPGGNTPPGEGGGSRLDTSGGFTSTDIDIDDTTGSPGALPSGICAPNSDITLLLANSQGSISLRAAGLMGLCTPNIVAQIIRLLMLLAGFFFTFAVIYSGIALFRSTSDEAMTQAKKNLMTSITGAVLVFAANWIIPVIIELVYEIAR